MTLRATDPLALWDARAAEWDRRRDHIWQASAHVSQWLVDRLDPQPGETVLELAAGTGETSLLLAERVGAPGTVISSDLSPAMVGLARKLAAERGVDGIDFRVADATHLDLADESVDAVLMRWGLMLIPEPARALQEIRRVLHPAGRLAVSVWSTPERNRWATLVDGILEDLELPRIPDRRQRGSMCSLGDRDRLRELLEATGFEPLVSEDLQVLWRYPDADAYWELETGMPGQLSELLGSLPAPALREVRSRVREELQRYRAGEGYLVPGETVNIVARRT